MAEVKSKKMFKGAPWNASDESAQKQLKNFLIAGWVIAILALFILGFIAFVALAFGARCIVLSWHKANATRPKGAWLKVASVALVVVGLLELVIFYSVK